MSPEEGEDRKKNLPGCTYSCMVVKDSSRVSQIVINESNPEISKTSCTWSCILQVINRYGDGLNALAVLRIIRSPALEI